MTGKGILVDYHWCCGCHTCEVACKQEHSFGETELPGVKVFQLGPDDMAGRLNVYWHPVFTDNCDLCAELTKRGERPACVKHCMTRCLEYGDVRKLAETASGKARQTIRAPR